MGSEAGIIAGGGWFTRQVVVRPKARFCTFLSIVWLAVLGFGLFLFWSAPPDTSPVWRWRYGLLAVPEPVFIGLAALFWVTEEPRTVSQRYPNPHFDLRKLY
jgi:hypothetical protein